MNGEAQSGSGLPVPEPGQHASPVFDRSMGERPVELHIEELVLDGFSGVDREVVGASLERELTRLLGSRFAPPSIREDGASPRADGGTFTFDPGMPPEEIGRQIARSIFWGMR